MPGTCDLKKHMKTEFEFTYICPRLSDLGVMALDHSQKASFVEAFTSWYP